MNSAPTVLVYDNADTADVLDAIYRPRGVRVERFSRHNGPAASTLTDAVLVIDSDSHTAPTDSRRRVLIGRWTATTPLPPPTGDDPSHTCRIPSLFHFGELVGAIDRLLSLPA